MIERRFYQHFECDPYFNMAFDEWLLEQCIDNPGSLFVRVYTWKPGAITFGYNQRSQTALNFEAVGSTPVIRRITGGRAIYHDPSELTYAIALNFDGLTNTDLGGPISRLSEKLAAILAACLTEIGIESRYVRRSSSRDHIPEFFHKAPCFASTAKYELVSRGQKVVASAQKRLQSAMLQHGSIKLAGVAPHPALSVPESTMSVQLARLEPDAFARLAEKFRAVVSASTGVELVVSGIGERDLEALKTASRALVDDPLSRREIIKRIQPTVSL